MPQPLSDANLRGIAAPGEYDRAIAYCQNEKAKVANRERLLKMLDGDPEAAAGLRRRTLARTVSPPAHCNE